MDLSIEDSVEGLRPKTEPVINDEPVSMADVGEILRKATPGIVVFDSDFTLKTKEYQLGLGGKEPGRVPAESMQLLLDLKIMGWQVLVVSNQPKEGHQVARFIKKIKKESYPIFPDSIKDVLGEEGLDGGGKDFLWNKYKNTPQAVEKTAGWIMDKTEKVIGQIYFVGDRESDQIFAGKVSELLKDKGENRVINNIKVKGLVFPKGLEGLERLIP